jgi:hypothetical protein
MLLACAQIDGGFKLENAGGLRFNGMTWDDNKNGKGSYQAQNVCLLARYGNKGDFGKEGFPTSDSKAKTGGTLKGPHYFGEQCKSRALGHVDSNFLSEYGATEPIVLHRFFWFCTCM